MCVPGRISSIPGIPMLMATAIPNLEDVCDSTRTAIPDGAGGATGKTGRLVLERALEAGHQVRALVRDPAKLTITCNRLVVVTGRSTGCRVSRSDSSWNGGGAEAVRAGSWLAEDAANRRNPAYRRVDAAAQRKTAGHLIRRRVAG